MSSMPYCRPFGGDERFVGRSEELTFLHSQPDGVRGGAPRLVLIEAGLLCEESGGLLAYELFGIKNCHASIQAGVDLEEQTELPAGQFTRRPNKLLRGVNEPFAAAIYPAALAAWAYLALSFDPRERGEVISPAIFAVIFAGILLYDFSLRMPEFFLFSYPRSLQTSLAPWLPGRLHPSETPPEKSTETALASSSANSSSTRLAPTTTPGNPQGNPCPNTTIA